MLLELGDLDYVTNCVIRMDGREFIRIGLYKLVVSLDRCYSIKSSALLVAIDFQLYKEYMGWWVMKNSC